MNSKKRLPRRGKWAGLTVNYVASMLGCHYNTARKLLLEKASEVNRALTPADIANLVYSYKDSKIPRLL